MYQHLYGFKGDDFAIARVAVESALGCAMDLHDSYYLGDYYKAVLASGVTLQLRRNENPLHERNVDPPEERYAEPKFQEHALLLYVDELPDADDRSKFDAISGITWLSTKQSPTTDNQPDNSLERMRGK